MKEACEDIERIAYKVILLLLFWAAVFAVPQKTRAQVTKSKVVVGYNDLPGFLYKDSAGNYRGYAYELMQKISAYNGWKCEYVQVPYSQIQEKLEDGTIDLFVPHQKTTARAKRFEYSHNVFCSNQASLLTRPDADLYYDDFSHFNRLKVGVEASTRNGSRFQKYLQTKGCRITLINHYLNTDQMEKALKKGEIDAFICTSNRGIDNCRVICQLQETKSYVLAKKGNRELLDVLDDAIGKIKLDAPLLVSNLEEKYKVSEKGCYPSLSRAEKEYIAEKNKVLVYVGPQDYNAETGEITGGTGKVLNLISQKTGLVFEGKTGATTEKIYNGFAAGKADIMFSFDHNYTWAKKHNAGITESYAQFNCVMVREKKVTTPKTLAVVRGSYLADYIKNYWDKKLIFVENPIDGMNLVCAGKADATVCNAPEGNYYATFPKYRNLVFSTMLDVTSSYCVAVSNHCDSRLLEIMEKALGSIPQATMNSYFEQQIYAKNRSMLDFFYENPIMAVGIAISFVVLLTGIIYALILIRITRKKNIQLVAANEAQSRFLSRVSHELRTPINAISGFAELAGRELEKENFNKTELKEYADETYNSTSYLLSIVNDILDMSRVENEKLELHYEIIDAKYYMENISAMIAPLAKKKNIHFSCRRLTYFSEYYYADGVRVQQILMNLLNNAIKFTPEGGHVTMTARGLSQEGNTATLEFTIEDDGIGMSEEFQKVMFEAFSQEDSGATSPYAGTGLGLSLCQKLAALMGGKISCESKKGQGTRFQVIITVKSVSEGKVQKNKEKEEQIEDIDIGGTRVLLCEDHPINQKVTRKLLENKNCLVEIAENGAIGVQKIEESAPDTYDIVLMDIRMPVMDGLEAAKAIRNLNVEDAKTIPIIAMSANAYQEDVQKSLEAGMNGHMAKPVSASQLYQTIEKYTKTK